MKTGTANQETCFAGRESHLLGLNVAKQHDYLHRKADVPFSDWLETEFNTSNFNEHFRKQAIHTNIHHDILFHFRSKLYVQLKTKNKEKRRKVPPEKEVKRLSPDMTNPLQKYNFICGFKQLIRDFQLERQCVKRVTTDNERNYLIYATFNLTT